MHLLPLDKEGRVVEVIETRVDEQVLQMDFAIDTHHAPSSSSSVSSSASTLTNHNNKPVLSLLLRDSHQNARLRFYTISTQARDLRSGDTHVVVFIRLCLSCPHGTYTQNYTKLTPRSISRYYETRKGNIFNHPC